MSPPSPPPAQDVIISATMPMLTGLFGYATVDGFWHDAAAPAISTWQTDKKISGMGWQPVMPRETTWE
jgi:hypothetical protein